MSAKPDVPSVRNAVEHLQELASRMRLEEFGFENNDISNIDKVIESLQELENGVIHLREHLETETIKASVHRHKLQFLPSEVKREMSEAVNSARLSNKAALEGLKSKLDNINSNTVYLENRQKVLEGENSVMHPERELIRKQHEEIICQLNQRLAEKAGKQITLNETRDKVRQANQTIVDLEDGILQLKEDLIQERAEARNEKKRLKKVVADTTGKNLTQLEQNYIKKKIVDNLSDELVSSDGQLEGLRKSIQRHEASRLRMEKQEANLEVNLAKELQESQALRMKSSKIDDAIVREQTEFDNKERMLKDRIKELDENIHSETIRNDDLEGQKYSLHLDLDDKLLIRKSDTDRVKELDITLQAGKQSLETKAVDVGKMQSENVDMKDQIVNLEESHKAIVSQLSKQIEEHRDHLGKERKERMGLQSRRDSVQKNLDEYKMDNQKFMTDMNKKIIESKGQHVELSNEGTQLQSKIRADSAKITVLHDNVTVATKEYEDMFTVLQSKLGTMKTDIVRMETSLVDKKDTIEKRTPIFEELETTFEERNESYDTIKKGIVTMKNKKSSLEDGVKRAKRDKEKMELPQTQLRVDLKKKREEALVQMKRNSTEIQDIEQKIYVSGCKLKTVLEENHKFDEGISKLQSDITDLNQQETETEEFKGKLQLEIARVKEQLLKGWDDDKEIETLFATRDQQIVNDLDELVGKTERRGTKISEITSQLESELLLLSSFLDNVSSRRPKGKKAKDTRESKRPQVEHREMSDLSTPLVATPRSLLSNRHTKSTSSQ